MELTKEEKELLLKDLSARLHYGVKVQVPQRISINPLRVYAIEQVYKSTFYCKRNGWLCKFWNKSFARLDEIKPYLRPMSSMTDEEKETWRLICSMSGYDMNEVDVNAAVDWLNANHFDYRGLIPMGLAIEVTEENNPYKE